jgi:hypothetical protein
MEQIAGKIPTRQIVDGWSEDKHLSFLAFCRLFIATNDKGETAWRVTSEARATAEAATDPSYKEFLERIQLSEGETTDKKFYHRLQTMVRLVLGYLRLNPSTITPQMREVLEGNKPLSWALTSKPAPLVVTRPSTVSPGVQMSYLHQQVLDLAQKFIESITPEEIAKMKTKDRLAAFTSLQRSFGAKIKDSRTSVFAHLKIEQASREELERAMLGYAEMH